MFSFVISFLLICGILLNGGAQKQDNNFFFGPQQKHSQQQKQQQQLQQNRPLLPQQELQSSLIHQRQQQKHQTRPSPPQPPPPPRVPTDHNVIRKHTVKSLSIAFKNITHCSATQPCCMSRTYSRSDGNIVVGLVQPSSYYKSVLPFSWNPQEVISGQHYHAMLHQSLIFNVGFERSVELMHQIPQSAVYFDVGANCGITALPVAAMSYNHNNTRRFSNLHLTEAVVTNQTMTNMELYVPKSRADNAAVAMKSAEKVKAGELLKINVPGVTIDAFVQQHKITKIALLKIDTQGYEYRVLQGAKHSLQTGIITTIFCENAPNLIEASGIDTHEYYHFMISMGFLPYNDIDDLLVVNDGGFILNKNLFTSNSKSKPQPLRALNFCPDHARSNQNELLKSYCAGADIFWISNFTINH